MFILKGYADYYKISLDFRSEEHCRILKIYWHFQSCLRYFPIYSQCVTYIFGDLAYNYIFFIFKITSHTAADTNDLS